MHRCWIAVCVITLAGCAETPPPAAPPAPPKDFVKVTPGPVDPDAPEEFTTTESGLKYRIRRQSDGKKPTNEDTVRVHYRGSFDDGKIFDSSYGTTGHSAEFRVNAVVKGWTEGLQLMGEGGMIELEIPPELGYGKYGRPPLMPPNATLHFIVELLDVKPTVNLPVPVPAPAKTPSSHP